MLDRLCGNEPLKAALRPALASGRLPHAILLCGADGLGRNFAARLIAADYLYPNGGAGAQAVVEGRSPECLTVRPEGDGDVIRVDRIRELRTAVRASALSAEGRIALVEDAHKMQPAAENALLKVLEEPPAGVVFLLTATSEAALLPTIRSRCARYALTPLDRSQAVSLLTAQGCAPADADFLWAVYDGALGRCLAAAQDPARMALLRRAADFYLLLCRRDLYGMLAAVREFEGKGEREQALSFLSDLAGILGAFLDQRCPPGLDLLDPEAAAAALPAVTEAAGRLRAAGSPKLIFTLLALRLAGR